MFVFDLFEKSKRQSKTNQDIYKTTRYADTRKAIDAARKEYPGANDLEALAAHSWKTDRLNKQQQGEIDSLEKQERQLRRTQDSIVKDLQDKEKRFQDFTAQVAQMNLTPPEAARAAQDVERGTEPEKATAAVATQRAQRPTYNTSTGTPVGPVQQPSAKVTALPKTAEPKAQAQPAQVQEPVATAKPAATASDAAVAKTAPIPTQTAQGTQDAATTALSQVQFPNVVFGTPFGQPKSAPLPKAVGQNESVQETKQQDINKEFADYYDDNKELDQQPGDSETMARMSQVSSDPYIDNATEFYRVFKAGKGQAKFNYGGTGSITLIFPELAQIVQYVQPFPPNVQEEMWKRMFTEPVYMNDLIKTAVQQKGLIEGDVIRLTSTPKAPDELKAYNLALEIMKAARDPQIPTAKVDQMKQFLFKDYQARIQQAPDGSWYLNRNGVKSRLPAADFPVEEDSWYDGQNAWSSDQNEWSSQHNLWTNESSNDFMAVDSTSPVGGNVRESVKGLYVGAPIEVVGYNDFHGRTGKIKDFSPSGKFVLVTMDDESGVHSMHGSDVKLISDYQYNEGIDYWARLQRERDERTHRKAYHMFESSFKDIE